MWSGFGSLSARRTFEPSKRFTSTPLLDETDVLRSALSDFPAIPHISPLDGSDLSSAVWHHCAIVNGKPVLWTWKNKEIEANSVLGGSCFRVTVCE